MTPLQGGGNLLIPVSSNCFIHCYNKPAIVSLFPRYPSPEMLNILLPAQAGTHCFQFNANCSEMRDTPCTAASCLFCCSYFTIQVILTEYIYSLFFHGKQLLNRLVEPVHRKQRDAGKKMLFPLH